jgi:hypothetical protein
MNLINNYVNIYYIMIMGYSLYYLILSFNSKLPWEKCDKAWASPNCVDNFDKNNFTFVKNCTLLSGIKCSNGQCYSNTTVDNLPVNNLNCNSLSSDILKSFGYWKYVHFFRLKK